MKPSERMKKLSEYLGISPISMATRSGLSRQRIRDIIENDGKVVHPDIADALCTTFPTISRLWILTGEGEMLVTDDHVTLQMNIPKGEDSVNVNELLAIIHTQQTQNNELREENKVLQGKFDALVEKMSSVTDELAKQRTIMMKIIMKEDVKDDTTIWYQPDIASEPKTKK